MNGSRRTVVANITLSLDGRINGLAGDTDMGWIVPHALTDVARDHMLEVTSPASTILLGRKNYQGFAGFWPHVAEMPEADRRDQQFSRWFTDTEKVVVTRTLTEPLCPNTTLTGDDPEAVVAELKGRPGGDIVILASAGIIRALLRADLVDRLSLTCCPQIVGGGDRLFDEGLPASRWAVTRSTTGDLGTTCTLLDRIPDQP
jgi:dihydrofolate reductase